MRPFVWAYSGIRNKAAGVTSKIFLSGADLIADRHAANSVTVEPFYNHPSRMIVAPQRTLVGLF